MVSATPSTGGLPSRIAVACSNCARCMLMRGRWPLGIASVSHLNATRNMPLVYLFWYSHFASAVEPCAPELEAVEVQIDNRCGVQRQQLAEHQAPHNRNAQGPPQLGARARAQRQRQAPSKRPHGGHDD